MLKEKDVLLAACGVDENGCPKNMTLLGLSIIDTTKQLEEMEDKFDDLTLHSACMSIDKGACFTSVTLTFPSAKEEECIMVKKMLVGFDKFLKNNPLPEHKISNVSLTIKPDGYDNVWISMGNGAWAITSSTEEGELDSIRFIFMNDFVRADQFVEE